MEGLRFACIPGCTNCCEQRGYVYLTEDDRLRAAAFLNLSPEEFEARYLYRTKQLLRLRKPPGKQCHFLISGACSIHPAKPTQCRLFPFWPELVHDREEWQRTASYCPGIGTGPLIQIGTAVETAEVMKQAYPTIY